MKNNVLLAWIVLLLPCMVVHGQERAFLHLDAGREDSAYLRSVSSQLSVLLETGEYRYVCVDQSAVEWMYVDQYVKGNPRLVHLLDYYAGFWSPACVECDFPNNYNTVITSLLNTLREHNEKSSKPVSVLGLDFLPDLEDMEAHATWLVYPVNRRLVPFNEATLTDSLMALTDRWWNSQAVAANTLRMMDARKDELTGTIGREYYILWRHFFLRYAEYQSSHRKLSPSARLKRLQEDFSYIDRELSGGKIIIGYDWLIHSLSYKNAVQ